MKLSIPEREIMSPGHLACQGCGAALAMRYVLKSLGKRVIYSVPACCWSVIDGPFPYSSIGVPLFHTAFETAAAVASGIKAGLEIQNDEETRVVAWAGDGGTFDIGLQALSGAAERNDDFIYVCYDNEAYMNTGIQRSSATPWGAWTTTTPVKHFKKERKKNIVEILAAHRIPYIATASIAYPEDLIKKVEKIKTIKGTKFLHIISPCPPGWKSPPELSVKLAKLAVQSKIFPIFEIENGIKYKINIHVKKPVSVKEYLKPQGRFKHLTDQDIEHIQQDADAYYEWLLKQEELSNE